MMTQIHQSLNGRRNADKQNLDLSKIINKSKHLVVGCFFLHFDNSAILAFDHLPRATPVRHTRHGNSQFEQCLTKTHLNKSEVPARQKQSTLLKKAGSPKPSKTLENTTQKFWIN